MAENISSVGSGKDYSNMTNWESAEQGLIAAGDQEVPEIYGLINDRIVVGGWSYGDSASKIIVRKGEDGAEWKAPSRDSATGLVSTSDTSIRINVEDLTLDLFGSYGIALTNATVLCEGSVERCTMYNSNGLAVGFVTRGVDLPASADYAVNNTVVDRIPIGIIAATGGVIACDYVTFYGTSGEPSAPSQSYCFARCICTDCASFNSINGDYLAVTAGGDYNVSSDGTAPGGNSVTGKTSYASYFTDYTNSDFSLIGHTADTMGLAGTPVSGITTDIVGTTRNVSTPDIGAYEFAAADPTPVTTNAAVTPSTQGAGTDVVVTATITDGDNVTTAVEAFAGADPGEGNGTAGILSGGGSPWTGTVTLDTTGLPYGDNTISIRGFSSDGWGAVDTDTLAVVLASPQNVTAESYDAGSILVTWDDVTDATAYWFFYNLTGDPVDLGDSNSNALTSPRIFGGFDDGAHVYLKVQARDGNVAHNSLLSEQVDAIASVPTTVIGGEGIANTDLVIGGGGLIN